MPQSDPHERALTLPDSEPSQPARPLTPLEVAGQVANRVAGQSLFQRYLSEKSVNTIKRHARDLELFAEYLLDAGVLLEHGADFQVNPTAWRGITWGIVEGFVQWQLAEGYAINSVNARLSTVKVYAQMAAKAGALDRQEGMLIQSVKGYSRAGGLNVDARRERTRIDEVTYAYRPSDRDRHIVITRRSTKKRQPTLLDDDQAEALKQVRNSSPQAWRDALLMGLLLEHGIRAGEAALLKAGDVHQSRAASGIVDELRFFRPKVKGTAHEWTTHRMSAQLTHLASYYMATLYPPALLPDGPLLLATSRLRKDETGGELLPRGLSRIRISERVAWLGRQHGITKLSAHDCRHTCATKMARLDYSVDELMAWFGWNSAQTAMRYIAAVEVQTRYRG